MMVMKAYPLDIFSLMARCLAGESTEEDDVRLAKLLSTHSGLKEEYKHFQRLFNTRFISRETSAEVDPQAGLDRVLRKLKEEGLI